MDHSSRGAKEPALRLAGSYTSRGANVKSGGEIVSTATFPGFPDLQSNVTFTPLQFFTVVLPHRSRGCVRLIGFMLRQLLGWVDENGNPRHEKVSFTYRELTEGAGISRDSIAAAIREALKHRMIECLRPPQRDKAGQPAQSGIYTLRWSDQYTNSPEEFTGFFRREAVVMSDGSAAPVAKAARKNIPNAFFDHLLRQERLSIACVVGTLLFRSIEWGPGGERRQPVCMSVTELSRLTNISRTHVHAALTDALRRGYVEHVKAGRFGRGGRADSEAATYRIRWTPSAAPTAEPARPQRANDQSSRSFTFSDRAEKVNEEAGGKGERDQPEKVNEKRAEKVNVLSIKRSIKRTITAAEGTLPNANQPLAAAASELIGKLVKVGFDPAAAEHLGKRYPAESILRQLEWLPLRQSSTNKLGLLRRAIEQDWPKPEGQSTETLPPKLARGAIFARHYETAFHRRAEPPATCSLKDAAAADEFLRRLKTDASEAEAAEWGSRFGAFARGKRPERPWLTWVLRVYGDEFARCVVQADSRSTKRPVPVAHNRSEVERLESLRDLENRYRRDYPLLYDEFARQQDHRMSRLGLSPKSRKLLAGDAARLLAFEAYTKSNGHIETCC